MLLLLLYIENIAQNNTGNLKINKAYANIVANVAYIHA